MVKRTRAQFKRMCKDIESKARILFLTEPDSRTGQIMSAKDLAAIQAIMRRCMNRLK